MTLKLVHKRTALCFYHKAGFKNSVHSLVKELLCKFPRQSMNVYCLLPSWTKQTCPPPSGFRQQPTTHGILGALKGKHDQSGCAQNPRRCRVSQVTSRGREFNVVDFTEANREDGRGGAVVAEPVRAVHCLRAVDPDHEVPVRQHLQKGGAGVRWWVESSSAGRSIRFEPSDRSSSLLTFLTVATQIAERLSGSMASNFIPSLNQSPFWSTSLTWRFTHKERQVHKWERIRASFLKMTTLKAHKNNPKVLNRRKSHVSMHQLLVQCLIITPQLEEQELCSERMFPLGITFWNNCDGASTRPSIFFETSEMWMTIDLSKLSTWSRGSQGRECSPPWLCIRDTDLRLPDSCCLVRRTTDALNSVSMRHWSQKLRETGKIDGCR